MLSRKHVQQQQVQLLLECGFPPISVDYRLCPETTVVAVGWSTGGHLALTLGWTCAARQQAWRSWEGLRAAGVDAEVRIVDGVPHLFDMYQRHMSREQTRRAVAEGYDFLCRHVGSAGAGSVDELADRLAVFGGVRTGV